MTACDLEKFFSFIMTVNIIGRVSFLFMFKHILASTCYTLAFRKVSSKSLIIASFDRPLSLPL